MRNDPKQAWRFDCTGCGGLCRVRYAVFLLTYGALLLVSFPWVMVWWLACRRQRTWWVRHGG